jgi:hypothetical protein
MFSKDFKPKNTTNKRYSINHSHKAHSIKILYCPNYFEASVIAKPLNHELIGKPLTTNCGSFYLSQISILLTSPLETASGLILGAFTVKTSFSNFVEMPSTFTLSGNRNCLMNRPLDRSTWRHWSVSCTSYLCLSLVILRLPLSTNLIFNSSFFNPTHIHSIESSVI